MSAYTKIACQSRDPDILVATLREMGYHPFQYAFPQRLEDYVGKSRKDTAEIIIPGYQLNSASNDVGFARQPDGSYVAIVSDFDRGVTFTPAKLEDLKLRYNVNRAKQIAERQHMRIAGTRNIVTNGKRSVQFVFEPASREV